MGILNDILGIADDIVSGATDFVGLTDYEYKKKQQRILREYEKGNISKSEAEDLLEELRVY